MGWVGDKMMRLLTKIGLIPVRPPVEERDPDYIRAQRHLRDIYTRLEMTEVQRQVTARENPNE